MRILYVLNNLERFNGWSKHGAAIIDAAISEGHEVICLTNKINGTNEKIQEYEGLKMPLAYLSNPITSFLSARRLQKIINKTQPDVLHILVEPYATLLPFLNLKKTKAVLTINGTYAIFGLNYNFISRFLSKKYYRKIDGLIPISKYTFDYFLKTYPKFKQENFNCKIETIVCGIDLNEHKTKRTHSSLKKSKKKQIIGVGNVKGRKGFLQAVEALNEYKKNHSSDFVYHIIGTCNENSPYVKKLREKIQEYGLEENVIIHGKVSHEELAHFFNSADLFFMLTIDDNGRFEGTGMVFIEAQAQGIPCIGSIESGTSAAVQDGVSGYLVDPKKPKETAQKIANTLLSNQITKEACKQNAQKNDIYKLIKQMTHFYSKL